LVRLHLVGGSQKNLDIKRQRRFNRGMISPPFSQRIGVTSAPKALQLHEINDALRNSLWNVLYELYDEYEKNYWRLVALHVAKNFRKVPADSVPYHNSDCRKWLREYFFSLNWHYTYEFIEFIVSGHESMTRQHVHRDYYSSHRLSKAKLLLQINVVLQRELSGYRFISGVLSPVSDETEAQAIVEAAQAAESGGLSGAKEHLHTALVNLGKKPHPDYRNSIKEAISAVESVAKQISGTKSQGLDLALDQLSKKTEIHGAMKAGFKSLYGYTSDEDGIRHAILEEPNVGFIEAKYMLVACSAFVYYLIQKADNAKLL
jgi:hypothetical protein